MNRNDEVHGAATAYEREKKARMRLSAREKEAKNSIIEVMGKHGLTVYSDPDGYIVTIAGKTDVKITAVESGGGEGETEE